jgi:hypothetical protein
LPAVEEEVEVEAALAEEVVVVLAEAEVEVEVLAVSVIPVEVPVHSKAVNPAVVQVDLEEAVKAPPGVQAVGVLEASNSAVVVPVVFAILVEAPALPANVKPTVVQVDLKGAVKARMPEAGE